jgi:uncharacterized protein (TIGR02302 family)
LNATNEPPNHEANLIGPRFRLLRALRRARVAIFWERLWPALATLATFLGLFLALSWAGLWLQLPPLGRPIGLLIFAALAIVALWPFALIRIPSEADGLRRLDKTSGLTHRPATALADDIAGNADPVAQALWRAHVERMAEAARSLKAGLPSPRLSLRDPMALRALVLLLAIVTFVSAGGDHNKRVAAAFDWRGVIGPANFRVDAWVTPPAYTGRAPVMLAGLRPGDNTVPTPAVSVPAGSILIVRGSGGLKMEIVRKGGIEPAPVEAKSNGPDASSNTKAAQAGAEQHFTIKTDGAATLRAAGYSLTWNFTAVPDRAPQIALAKDPEAQARGALLLAYKIEDDYGVTQARANFTRKETDTNARPLYDAPDMPLVLPQARTRAGAAQTIKDLSEHPWAGGEVTVTLTARDEAGNEGKSQPHDFTLPQRLFVKPMARVLVEQRRVLALDANAKRLVLTALEALTIAPERFEPDTKIYLGLRSLFYDLTYAKTDDALRDVAARMWAMAVQIEDGNVSDAEQALRQAQDALRQALERGATDEEIKKLMDQLRAALDRFMQALAEEMRKNPQQLARPLDHNTKTMTPQDLKSMLDKMEQMARSGNKDAARRMLDELQQMLENLQTARPGQQMDGGDDDDMMSSLDELQDMIRKQQQLRDRTFKEGQDQRGNRQRGQQRNDQMGNLQQDQQALRDRLKKLLDAMKQRGKGQGEDGDPQQGQGQGEGQGDQQLGDADGAMGDAQGQLGDGDAEGATGSQGRALDAMRKGAQNLAQQMQQQGNGPGPNGQPGRGQQRAQQNTDPLGRPLRGRDYGDDVTVKVPGEIDVQRARKILEELRKRFGESYRPQIELDYIERLLKDF